MEGFSNILCVIDSDQRSGAALERAVTLAENNQARLSVVAISEALRGGRLERGRAAKVQMSIIESLEQWLDEQIRPYADRVEIDARVLTGSPFLEVTRDVLRHDRDLVIKDAEAPDWADRLFGGDDMHLLRKCPCPVWLVKPGSPGAYRRILAAVDVDDNYPRSEMTARDALNERILSVAGALAMSEFAQMHVVHVWDALGENTLRHGAFTRLPDTQVDEYVDQVRVGHEQRLAALMSRARETLGPEAVDYIKPQSHLLKGSARREIPAAAHRLEADCIVMGTVARTGVRGFIMGNTAESILQQIDCPVLALKPPGFVTPVTLDG